MFYWTKDYLATYVSDQDQHPSYKRLFQQKKTSIDKIGMPGRNTLNLFKMDLLVVNIQNILKMSNENFNIT